MAIKKVAAKGPVQKGREFKEVAIGANRASRGIITKKPVKK